MSPSILPRDKLSSSLSTDRHYFENIMRALSQIPMAIRSDLIMFLANLLSESLQVRSVVSNMTPSILPLGDLSNDLTTDRHYIEFYNAYTVKNTIGNSH